MSDEGPGSTVTLDALHGELMRAHWLDVWPEALAVWSPYVQLHQPEWCLTHEDENRESLSGSFAMIRLVDHTIVVSLRQIAEKKLQPFAKEILAHEIGHHVYCPGDLTDNARLLARIRVGLPTCEHVAPYVSNLYSDLMINDWLQRTAGLDIAGVYRRLHVETNCPLWRLYMQIYEVLWRLQERSLVARSADPPPLSTASRGPKKRSTSEKTNQVEHDPIDDARFRQDAQLGARLVRSYSKEWLAGASRFAALCLPYVIRTEEQRMKRWLAAWNDTRDAGKDGFPEGLAAMDDDELAGAPHPAEDPALSGLDPAARQDAAAAESDADGNPRGRVSPDASGQKSERLYRDPFAYRELLKASGATLDERELAARYYRERALPHVIPFPTQKPTPQHESILEGLDTWDVSSPLEEIDWFQSLLVSPVVVPGVTTRTRLYGEGAGGDPRPTPYDLYLGVDCSGSMGDPAARLSYPVLAGAVMLLSALRAGSKVKVVLSGEPGSTIAMPGFSRDDSLAMRTLVNYLGTGFSFGIHRLAETFDADWSSRRPTHILVLSDHDMFSMLEQKQGKSTGWDVAAAAVARCGGGATFLLQLPQSTRTRSAEQLARMKAIGWNIELVDSMDELVEFARRFSRTRYGR